MNQLPSHTLEDFEANLRQLEVRLREAGAVVVFQTYYAMLPEVGPEFANYMAVVRQVAHSTGARLIDQFAWFTGWQRSDLSTYRRIMRDGAHLKPLGNALFGTLAGRTFGLWGPVVPAELPTNDYLPAPERHGAPSRNLVLP